MYETYKSQWKIRGDNSKAHTDMLEFLLFWSENAEKKISKTREKLLFRDLQELISTLSILPLAAEIGLWCEVTREWKKK